MNSTPTTPASSTSSAIDTPSGGKLQPLLGVYAPGTSTVTSKRWADIPKLPQLGTDDSMTCKEWVVKLRRMLPADVLPTLSLHSLIQCADEEDLSDGAEC